MKYKNFEELQCWQDARKLVKDIYDLAGKNDILKRDFGFRDQIQRAAISIMNNIAEGFDTGSSSSFVRFLGYSQASCSEVQSMLYVASDVGYVSQEEFKNLCGLTLPVRKQIKGFIKYLRNKAN